MQKLKTLLKKEAQKIDTALQKDIDKMAAKNAPLLIDTLRYGLLGGGKRVRPFLLLTAASLCGNDTDERYSLALAFEYLHGATLFHDDIIDNSPMRRGKPSVQAQFGKSAAILAGDFLLAHAMEIVARQTGAKGLEIFNRATRGMVNGEFYQLHNAESFSIDKEKYKQAVMRKTGLLIAGSCEIGALFAGAEEVECAALRSYGENLGYAFQIVDDLLDYQGESGKTGKTVGNDLSEGKMTLPLIYAVCNGEKKESSRLLEIISDTDLRKKKEIFNEAVTLIEKNGGFHKAKMEAKKAITEGITALTIFQGEEAEEHKEILALLGEFVLQRSR